MNHLEKSKQTTSQTPIFKKSLLAMCIVAASHQGHVYAAEAAPAAEPEEVVVTGLRESLNSAQDIKKASATFVDAISAKDIGALPDKSVTEALQRVPGVTVSKYAAPVDPDHFSAEGSGVVIRGLGQSRSEFNGRDTFTANSGSGLSFQDVSPELMGKVEVFKNQTASMIEGGISGTVNLTTRLPFDKDGQVFSFNVEGNYSDLAEETSPSISGLYSNVWETDAGKFGILGNVAISNIKTRSEGVQLGRWIYLDTLKNPKAADSQVGDQIEGGQTSLPGMIPGIFMPRGAAMRYQDNDRDRKGYAAAVQWENPSETALATFQFIRSDATAAWNERYVGAVRDNTQWDATIIPGTDAAGKPTKFQTDSQGNFVSGIIGNSKDVNGLNKAMPMSVATRTQETNNLVDDYGFHLKLTPTDKLKVDLDAQYVNSKVKGNDFEVEIIGETNYLVDRSGGKPTFAFLDRTTGAPTAASNGKNFYWRDAMDHFEDSKGNENAFAVDVDYEIDSGWFKSVETGVRMSDREQHTQNSKYNWGALDAGWSGDKTDASSSFGGFVPARPWEVAYQGHADTLGASQTENVNFNDFYRGDVNMGNVVAPSIGLVSNSRTFKEVATAAGIPVESWNAIGTNLGDRAGEVNGGDYLRNEIRPVDVKNQAIYGQLNFGSEDLAVKIDGNLGVRYVNIDVETSGYSIFPFVAPTGKVNDVVVPNRAFSLLTPAQQNYVKGGDTSNSVVNNFSAALPSLNIKFGLTDELILRFGASKAISLPQMGLYNNYTEIKVESTTFTNASGMVVTNNDVTATKAVAAFSGKGGNPNLKPMEAVQADLGLEWYFADAGSLTGTIFNKDLTNYFQSESRIESFVSPAGSVESFAVTRPRNGGKSSVKGFELAYQQFYDFLPEPLDGFGIQANYTHVKNDGAVNSGLKADNPDGVGNSINFDALPLEGLSEDTINFTLMYQKEAFESRLAYNWRSDYLVTASDAVEKMPIFNKATGNLDASITYALNDNYKVGLQITNLLDEETETFSYLSTASGGGQSHDAKGNPYDIKEPVETDRGWFVNDRRFALFVRGNF